jgi:chemotaxis protein methyltransferase CheR
VEGRLRRRVRLLGYRSLGEYCRFLFERDGLERELHFVIDAVTTNKTDFFREPEHFQLLERRLVGEILAGRSGGGTPLLKVWSAASSNGSEAYSLAMLLAEMAGRRRDFRFAVLATDISTAMLAAGERAVYPEELVAPVPKAMQDKYLMRAKRAAGRVDVRIVPELRRAVAFEQLNLMDASYPFDRDVDVIFLRNVLIYFERADQEAVIRRLVGHLRPSGYLFLGHSESMIGAGSATRSVAPAVFQKL